MTPHRNTIAVLPSTVIRSVALATIILVCACASSPNSPGESSALQDASTDTTGKIPGPAPDRLNEWGGEHLDLVQSDTGATLQYDCAHGTISGRVTPDASGRFVASGTHVFEHGGPVRADETEDRHSATFTGRIVGSSMTLSVTVSGVSALLGPFILQRGVAGRLYRCY